MAQPQYPPPANERWNVNLPAVIGVVFVFLVGVVIWVIVASGDDDGDADDADVVASSSTVTTEPDATTSTSTTAPGTTTPAPMPDPTAVTTTPTTSTTTTSSTVPTTSTTSTTTSTTTTTEPVPPTTSENSEPGAVPGDLGIPGFPMQAPPCTDSFITIIASVVGADVAPEGILAYLEDYSTSNYLRTDQTCPSLTQDIDGEPIYVVFFGPFPFASDACEASAQGTEDSYVRTLSETQPPDHTVDCDA